MDRPRELILAATIALFAVGCQQQPLLPCVANHCRDRGMAAALDRLRNHHEDPAVIASAQGWVGACCQRGPFGVTPTFESHLVRIGAARPGTPDMDGDRVSDLDVYDEDECRRAIAAWLVHCAELLGIDYRDTEVLCRVYRRACMDGSRDDMLLRLYGRPNGEVNYGR